jgi:hypothetical protein
MDINELN